jgi:glycosyltransferase involved in cell wall biosynthesis
MRILYDISVLGLGTLYSAGRTGVYRVVEHVAEGLVRASDIELLFCATQGYTQRAPKTVQACRHYLAQRPLWQSIPFLEGEFPPVDVFHSPYHPIPPDIEAAARILTVHDLIALLFPKLVPAPSAQLQKLSLHLLKPTDHIICNSSVTRQDLCRLGEIDFSRTHITHLAAEKSIFHPCEDADLIEAVRIKYNLGQFPYILSLCTLEPRKNLVSIIRAFSRLLQKDGAQDIRLVLVGAKGWDFKQLFSEIEADPAIHPRIVTTGYVPDEDLSPLYSSAALFVYMSFYEGFGLPALEAMQCGTPVIVSNSSSLPEVVGDAGVLLAPEDVSGLHRILKYVLSDPELRREMSLKALRQASRFSWGKCVDQTIAAYRRALADEEPLMEVV